MLLGTTDEKKKNQPEPESIPSEYYKEARVEFSAQNRRNVVIIPDYHFPQKLGASCEEGKYGGILVRIRNACYWACWMHPNLLRYC